MKSLFTSFSSKHYTIGIITGLLIYLGLAEGFLRLYVVPKDNQSKSAAFVYESKKNNVVIGDSQTVRAFASCPPSFVNLSSEGMSAEMMEVITKEYYKHRKPRKAIILANPQLFSQQRMDTGDQGYKNFFKLNIGNIGFMPYSFEKLISRNLADIGKWLTYKRTVYKPWSEMSMKERDEEVRGRIKIQRPVKDFRHTSSFGAYKNMLQFLKESRAEVCLVRTPISTEYQEMIYDDPDFKLANAALKEMAGQYGFNYIDFRQLPVIYDDAVFMNQDHITEEGSKIFAPYAEKYCFDNVP